ncbi:MAG: secretin N-terminal domain-containing protein, partial [Planctomycetota bacterium]
MLNHSHRISHNGRLLLAAVVVLGFLAGPGCHDWPDERSTAIEAQNILRDLSRIDTVDDPNIPIPAAYKLPPQKFQQLVGGAEEWKLVYCCKYHTADKMRIIIEEQFSSTIFDAKGKSKTVPNFGVSAHPDTNQLIVRCLTEEDVDAVQEIIEAADIPPIQVKIECMVSEVYADLTVDRETRVLIENLFGEGIVLGGNRDNEF